MKNEQNEMYAELMQNVQNACECMELLSQMYSRMADGLRKELDKLVILNSRNTPVNSWINNPNHPFHSYVNNPNHPFNNPYSQLGNPFNGPGYYPMGNPYMQGIYSCNHPFNGQDKYPCDGQDDSASELLKHMCSDSQKKTCSACAHNTSVVTPKGEQSLCNYNQQIDQAIEKGDSWDEIVPEFKCDPNKNCKHFTNKNAKTDTKK